MNLQAPLIFYFQAKHHVYETGYFNEVYYQETRSIENVSKSAFFREYAWVVLSSGLGEKVVLKIFPKLCVIFNNWKNPFFIIKNQERIFREAIGVFNNKGKIGAILDMAKYLVKKPFSIILSYIKKDGIDYLMKFKFLGPATSYHLAKNIGFNLAKPDRHLVRISECFGFKCVNEFCERISSISGDKRSVVDTILWRFATLKINYLSQITNA